MMSCHMPRGILRQMSPEITEFKTFHSDELVISNDFAYETP